MSKTFSIIAILISIGTIVAVYNNYARLSLVEDLNHRVLNFELRINEFEKEKIATQEKFLVLQQQLAYQKPAYIPKVQHLSIGQNSPINNTNPNLTNSDVIQTTIDGDFEGWDGETLFIMLDGSIWQQSSYDYTYHYDYMPDVLIYKKDGTYHLKVEGLEDEIEIVRVK